MTKKSTQQHRGFTLVELIVMLVLIGIITSVTIMTIIGSSATGTVKSPLQEANELLETYPGGYARVYPPASETSYPKDHEQFAGYVRWASNGATPRWLNDITYTYSESGGTCLEEEATDNTFGIATGTYIPTTTYKHVREGGSAEGGRC